MSSDGVAHAGGLTLRHDAPLGPLCTYRVGGPARWLVHVDDPQVLAGIAPALRELAGAGGPPLPLLIVGQGSNLLVTDAGFPGLVVVPGPRLASLVVRTQDDGAVSVRVGGAARLPAVARRLAAAGVRGFEWAVGVPGSIGGAVRMNAGGHGSDLAASLEQVSVVDLRTGAVQRLGTAELQLGYRTSALRPDQLVVEAQLRLERGDPAVAGALIDEIVAWRRANQPGGHNAGSVFANPPGDSAGRLVEAAGAKGLRVGSAHVSRRHANFIQADDGGQADDVHRLMLTVRSMILEQGGPDLRPETVLVGFPPWPQDRDRAQAAGWPAADRVADAGSTSASPIGARDHDTDDRIEDGDVERGDGDDARTVAPDDDARTVAPDDDAASGPRPDADAGGEPPPPAASAGPPAGQTDGPGEGSTPFGVVVDPRFEARRAAVQRDARRHRRHQALAALALIAAVVGMYGLLRSPTLDVDRIQVLGGQTSGMDAIQRALGISVGDQMVDLDLGAAEHRLEQLPWVRTARVVRSWPATLRVIVVERHPEARIADPDGRWWLADGTGRLLDVVSDPPPDLLQVDGYVIGGQRGMQLSQRATEGLALAAQLPLDVARRTASLRFPDPDGIDLVVDPEDPPSQQRPDPPPSGPDLPAPYAVVHLGSTSAADEKLLAASTVLDQVDPTCLAEIDVRVPAKPVVTRRSGCG
jgi:UDP-N-acetylmuramate dehydrogenase